ncbi:MAG: glycosyltransferase [bacterium]|nr:glycosyltransferase [bacterium]
MLKVYWDRIPIEGIVTSDQELKVSVLIPVRDEATSIKELLNDIADQNYNNQLIEVLIIDDYSEDGTKQIVQQAIKELEIAIKLYSLKELQAPEGKKSAITIGVSKAQNDIILCTDGDCRISKDWVRNYVHQFLDNNINMVLGPVVFFSEESSFVKLQQLEFAGLIGLGAASLEMGAPIMCNGANLGYRKSLFERVQGFDGNTNIASGDDEFLLQKAFDESSDSVRFIKSADALVSTSAKHSAGDFLNQRIRWASKWRFHKQSRVTIWAILVFLFQAATAIGIIGLFFMTKPGIALGILAIKVLAEFFYLKSVSEIMGVRLSKLEFCILQVMYPFYIVFLSIISLFIKYNWKGRSYK